MFPWWITLIAAIVPSIISSIVAVKISNKNQLQKNTESIENLSKDFAVISKKILDDIGRNDNSSLTRQHNDIQEMISKETQTIERRYDEEAQRYRMFTAEQHNTAKQIEEFRLFMEDWERLAASSSEKDQRIHSLEEEIQKMRLQQSGSYANQSSFNNSRKK